jgi:type IV secretory pathway TraG/TraD family ATPase VirD4
MIGSFLVTKFQIDAMSRADIEFKKRRDFYLYIDEFQNFATESFESILSEARKYRLSLIVANQYTSQIEENVRNAIFGNVGTIVSFGLGYDDATIMSQQFKQLIVPNDLLSLPKFKAYIKLMVNGVTVDPFTMGTFPLPDPELSDEIKEKIRKQSRQRYAMQK